MSLRENATSSNKDLLETVISNAPEEIQRVPFEEEVPQIGCQISTVDSTDELWMEHNLGPQSNAVPRVSPVGSPLRKVGGMVNIQACSPCNSNDNCSPDSDREELDLDLDYQVLNSLFSPNKTPLKVNSNQCQSDIPDAPDYDNGNYF